MRLLLKMMFVAGMTIAIMIPLMLIRGTISERKNYRAEAVQSIAQSYAGEQVFAGPVLVVPYTETELVEEKDGLGVVRQVAREKTRHWTFFPKTLDITGTVKPDTRKRGLHEVRVYAWQGKVNANFDVVIPNDAVRERRIGQPWLSYGIADVRGLLGKPVLQVNGQPMALSQGIGSSDGAGLHLRLAAPLPGQSMRLQTGLGLTLRGTESLALMPLGDNNRFVLESSWAHPSFDGISPLASDISGKGFRAEWEIPALASNARASYLLGFSAGNAATRHGTIVGGRETVAVSLVEPVNIYSQADRATKYGLLFVVLTFVGFFMLELIKQLPIHPVQYGLVGLALAIFFLLLVSLSEHIAFHWAYVAASVACIGLLGFYLSAVLRSVGRGLGFAAMLATLYAALYGLLVSEDNALVLGSGLLFVILAAIMVITRKVDWYQLGVRQLPSRTG